MECKDEEEKWSNKEIYKVAKTEAKLAVTLSKMTSFKLLYTKLRDKRQRYETI